jgi:gluconokinase
MLGNRLIVVMGPAGAGKSTIARALSQQTTLPMIEADDYHPQSNRKKMAAGIPLEDKDRAAWIDALAQASHMSPASSLILACSALTPYVQGRLKAETAREIVWLLLEVPKAVLQARMEARTGHFMPASLLDDQLCALTPPEDAISIHADQPIEAVLADILAKLDQAC